MTSAPARPIYRRQRVFFRRAYETGEHGWPTEGPTPEVARFLRRIPARGRALDLGCGEGRHSILLARRGFSVDAVDLAPPALRRARAFALKARVAPRIRFRTADALGLPFAPGTFDLVLDYGCFHHIVRRDWARYRREVLRVLRPGGSFLLSVFSTKFRHFAGERRTRPWIVHRNHIDRFFTRRDLVGAFRPAFEVVSVVEERRGLSGFWHAWMRKPPARASVGKG